MGFPSGWTQLEEVAKETEEDSERYHALGNAVTPPVVEVLARRIASYLKSHSSKTQEAMK